MLIIRRLDVAMFTVISMLPFAWEIQIHSHAEEEEQREGKHHQQKACKGSKMDFLLVSR